jgi:DNA-binding response OmpR family regulator
MTEPAGHCPLCGSALDNATLRANVDLRACVNGDVAISLSPHEATIMSLLIRRSPHIVQTDSICAAMWPSQDEPEDAIGVLRVTIHRLNAKLAPANVVIKNMPGIGYRLVPQ